MLLWEESIIEERGTRNPFAGILLHEEEGEVQNNHMRNRVTPLVLASSGCHNRLPDIEWLEQHSVLLFPEAKSMKSRCQHGLTLGEGPLSGFFTW